MESKFALHLSLYTTLALAAISLAFAEFFFLPWLPVYLFVLLVLGGLAWKHEGRWQLTEGAANTIGLVIGLAMFGWILFQIPRNEHEFVSAGVPWPAGLLPHLGPLLMTLTAVKLFRPKKVSDFWVLQVLGVMMVTLASVLAGDFNHGLWVFLYLVSLVWCLVQFYPVPRDGVDAEVPLFPPESIEWPATRNAATRGLTASFGWALVVSALGVTLFFFAPRHGGVQWIPHKLTVGAAGRFNSSLDAGMDLTRVGKIELSDEIAFEAAAQDADGHTLDLPEGVYWRSEALDYYQNGRWYSGAQSSDSWGDFQGIRDKTGNGPRGTAPLKILSVPSIFGSPHPSQRPDDIPSDFTYLSIRTSPGLGNSLVLAEPVDVNAGVGLHPYLGDRPSRSGLFGHLVIFDTVLPLLQTRRPNYTYGQAVNWSESKSRTPATTLHPRYINAMLRQDPPAELIPWARRLLLKVTNLSPAARTLDDNNQVAPEHHADVAHAISRHFSESGQYLYSLNLRRVDSSVDPNVDFLTNVKEGHCERYASGLTLTLRALGIPARVIHGFRGGEKTDDHRFLVRFNQAHSWVQTLVPNKSGEGHDWLLLDPTPSREAELDAWASFNEWWRAQVRRLKISFHHTFIEYGSDQQTSLLRSVWSWIASTGEDGIADPRIWAILFVGMGSSLYFGRRPLLAWWYRRNRVFLDRSPWLTESLAVLRDCFGLSPLPSETLREFSARLALSPAAMCAEPFRRLVESAERTAFSTHEVSDSETSEAARAIRELTKVRVG